MVVLRLSQTIHIWLRTHLQLRKIFVFHLYSPQLTGRRSTPFPLSRDGVLADGSIINYTPNDPKSSLHSCWTAPKSRPRPSHPYEPGRCSVCMVQRSGTDGSADYQLWARDMANNAMGNMYATTVTPINVQKPGIPLNASMTMGGSPLLLQSTGFKNNLANVKLLWAQPPLDPNDPAIWNDPRARAKIFDPASEDPDLDGSATSDDGGCANAGSALNGAVRYAQCVFPC